MVDGDGLRGGLLAQFSEDGGVFDVGGEVGVLGGIGFQVEEHFELGSAVFEIDVCFLEAHFAIEEADVFPALRADAFLKGVVPHGEEAFEEELTAPRHLAALDKRAQAAAFHLGGSFDAGVVEDGAGVVEARD